jgi:putative NADPH-quinone reductase
MRVLVIYCHPVAESFAAAAHARVLQALADGGHEVTVRHGRSITFQMAEVMVPRDLFRRILAAITDLRPRPAVRC